MSVNYLHGIETVEIDVGSVPIRTVKTSVIGLIGTAPIWQVSDSNKSVNKIVLINNMFKASRYFGKNTDGYTIPSAVKAIFEQGGAEILVVNVFDPSVHKSSVEDVSYTFNLKGYIQLAHNGVANVLVKSTDTVPTVYTKDEDYNVDVHGKITRIASGRISAGETVKVSYDYADVSKVTTADIIGDITPEGVASGLRCFERSFTLFGFFPRLLIAPVFVEQKAVASALISLAHNIRAMALIDAPANTTFQQAIEGRGETSSMNFNTSSERAILCYPHLKVFDTDKNDVVIEPFSQRLAGVIARKDKDKGYWWSPSNTEIKGIVGAEVVLTSRINEPESETNAINEAGIVTLFNSFGTGLRVWGNRTAAWPTETHPKNFISVRRTADIIYDSIEYSMMQFLDRPITQALIDAIAESVNVFMRTLIARGAMIDGKCWFNKDKNPPEEIALGHLTFDVDFMPPPPAERITFDAYIDVQLLQKLGGQ